MKIKRRYMLGTFPAHAAMASIVNRVESMASDESEEQLPRITIEGTAGGTRPLSADPAVMREEGSPVHTEGTTLSMISVVTTNTLNSSSTSEPDDFEMRRRWTSRKLAGRNARQMLDTLGETATLQLGTTVDEDHVNYVLMYDMLTGIRIAVSRCEAKQPRKPLPSDFAASNKLAFDITGNELTPSSKYDFKFKDYSPWIFRSLRELFKIDAADYLISLTGKYVLSELGSPGKSGSFFYYSQDFRFIIKTIHHAEHLFLRRILKHYYDYVIGNPNTLLCRFYGLHRVKLPHGKKIHFVVMGNILPPNKDIHELFDLKGSTLGRQVSPEEIQSNPRVVRKDLNWLAADRAITLGPSKKKIFLDQLERDTKFLVSLKIMDYSLLLAIHFKARGNSEKIRDKSLSIFQPNPESLVQVTAEQRRTLRASAMRKAIVQADPVALDDFTRLPEEPPNERKMFFFYQDDGGFSSTDALDQPDDELYFMGIIDILTPYSVGKKFEHAFKSIRNDENTISAVPPQQYGERFLAFIRNSLAAFPLADAVCIRIESLVQLRMRTSKHHPNFVRHSVTGTDTLEGLALKYDVPVHEIKSFNGIWNSCEVQSRKTLVIPRLSQELDIVEPAQDQGVELQLPKKSSHSLLAEQVAVSRAEYEKYWKMMQEFHSDPNRQLNSIGSRELFFGSGSSGFPSWIVNYLPQTTLLIDK